MSAMSCRDKSIKKNMPLVNAVKSKRALAVRKYIGSGKLIPIDFTDKNYEEVGYYAKDTITTNGWAIKYLIKDDSTRYDDLYIIWEKKGRKGIYSFKDVLHFRRYFIPVYKGENDNHLFLTHACATTCKAVLTFSTTRKPICREFISMVDYNISKGEVVYVSDSGNLQGKLEVTVCNLKNNIEKYVVFNNIPLNIEAAQNIDSVVFKKNRVKLFANMIDKGDKTKMKMIKETQIVNLLD